MKKTILAGIIAELLLPVGVFAQTNPDATAASPQAGASSPAEAGVPFTVVVTGIRASIESSQAAKRDAQGIVDVITSEDVGKFPDTNVAEALQRLPGVSLERTNGEGRQISVRGMGPEFNNVLINGRSITTDTGGRGFSFDILPSSMISKASIFKTSVASLPEGGIGATIDIETIRPLEYRGKPGTFNIGVNYDDKSKQKSTKMDGVYTYVNSARDFGVTSLLSYSKQKTRYDVFSNPMGKTSMVYLDTPLNAVDLPVSALKYADNVVQPFGPEYTLGTQDKERLTGNFTAQYKPTKDWVLTLDAMYSKLNQKDLEFKSAGYFGSLDEPGGFFLNPTINKDGVLTGFEAPGSRFLNNNPAIRDFDDNDHWRIWPRANEASYNSHNREGSTGVLGLNSKWKLGTDWQLVADLSSSRTTMQELNPFAAMQFEKDLPQRYDWDLASGNLPSFLNPGDISNNGKWQVGNFNVVNVNKSDTWTDAHVNLNWDHERGYFQGANFGLSLNQRNTKFEQFEVIKKNAYKNVGLLIPTNFLSTIDVGNYLGGAANAPKAFAYVSDIVGYQAWLNDPATQAKARKKFWPVVTAAGPMAQAEDPRTKWAVTEKVTSAFVDTKWEGSQWQASVGARIVNVQSTSTGISRDVLTATTDPLFPLDLHYSYTYTPYYLVSKVNDYTDILPSGNIRFNLTPTVVLRAGLSKTVTRPTMDQLQVQTEYGGSKGHPTINGKNGNPSLTAMHSLNKDVSLEWYVSKTTSVAFAAFSRDMSGFLEAQQVQVAVPYVPELATYSRVGNGAGVSTIKGTEVEVKYVFERASMFSGFGATANYSTVSKKEPGALVSDGCNGTPGLSPKSYNLSGFYENEKLQARVSYNGRNAYLLNCATWESNEPTWRDSYAQVDAGFSYKLTPTIGLYTNIVNLTNSKSREFSRYAERLSRLEVNGRRFDVGMNIGF